MEKTNFLTIDCGTQSTRVMIFDKYGNILAKEKIEYEPYFSLKPGYAEQDANVFWNSIITGCQQIKEHSDGSSDLLSSICAVGVTTQRDSMVLVDKEGNPIRAAITWLDQRTSRPVYRPKGVYYILYNIIGMYQSLMKTQAEASCNWLMQNEPENFNKAVKFLQVSGFINRKLTGKFVDSTASQIGHIPFNYKKQRWAKKGELNKLLFPVDDEKLPELYKPGAVIGYITEEAGELTGIPVNTKVIACGSDKGCETLGMGCLHKDQASLSFGTTATIQVSSKKYFEPLSFMPAYPAAIAGYYNPEVEIFRGYWLISWFKREFCAQEVLMAEKEGIPAEIILNKNLEQTPPGSLGLIVQPYWSPGLKTPYAKGAIIGFGDIHTKKYMYRAVVEGLSYALKEGLYNIQKSGKLNIKKLYASGGASQADEICQIAADIFNLPLYRGKTYETSSLGAAILCSIGTGCYKSFDEAIEKMVSYDKVFQPDAKNSSLYESLYNDVYRKIYKKLSSLYKEIQKITDYPEKF